MRKIDIQEAKMQLSRLVEEAASGKPFLIARAGRPVVKVVAVDALPVAVCLGALRRYISAPDDFDRMGENDIARLFVLAD